jgi:hypothetical protein
MLHSVEIVPNDEFTYLSTPNTASYYMSMPSSYPIQDRGPSQFPKNDSLPSPYLIQDAVTSPYLIQDIASSPYLLPETMASTYQIQDGALSPASYQIQEPNGVLPSPPQQQPLFHDLYYDYTAHHQQMAYMDSGIPYNVSSATLNADMAIYDYCMYVMDSRGFESLRRPVDGSGEVTKQSADALEQISEPSQIPEPSDSERELPNLPTEDQGSSLTREARVATRKYVAVLDDEIGVDVGNLMRIDVVFSDGWAKGGNMSLNLEGVFPMYVFGSS